MTCFFVPGAKPMVHCTPRPREGYIEAPKVDDKYVMDPTIIEVVDGVAVVSDQKIAEKKSREQAQKAAETARLAAQAAKKSALLTRLKAKLQDDELAELLIDSALR